MDRKALFFLYKGWYIYCTRLKWLHILISSFYIVMLLIGFRINSKIFKSCLFLFRRKHLDNLFHFIIINGRRIFLKTKIVAAQSIQKVPIIGKWLIFSTKLLNMNKSLLGHSFHFLFFFRRKFCSIQKFIFYIEYVPCLHGN